MLAGQSLMKTLSRQAGFALGLLWMVIAGVQAEQLPIKTYTTAEGLAHNRVKRIVQDSHGFLWFCTSEGLSRFDGSHFTTYGVEQGLPFPSLNDLLETRNSFYWLATNGGGVVRFNLSTGVQPATQNAAKSQFTVYSLGQEPAANRVNVLYQDGTGTLWAGTDGGLFRFEETNGPGIFRRVELGIASQSDLLVQVWALVEDREGSLWVGTKFGLLRRLPDGRMVHYSIQSLQGPDTVFALLIDREERLWVGHQAGLMVLKSEPALRWQAADVGLRSEALSTAFAASANAQPSISNQQSRGMPAVAGEARRYTTAHGLGDNSVRALHQASGGQIWIATSGVSGSSLAEFDGDKFRLATDRRVSESRVLALTEDRDGNLWLATTSSGARKIARHGFITYGETDGLGQVIGAVFENQSGEICVTSDNWLISRFDGYRFTSVQPNLPKRVLVQTLKDVDNWWYEPVPLRHTSALQRPPL